MAGLLDRQQLVGGFLEGAFTDEGVPTAELGSQLVIGYERSIVFVPKLRLINGHVDKLAKAFEHMNSPKGERPARALLAQVALGQEPVSLHSVVRIAVAFQWLFSMGREFAHLQEVIERFAPLFPHPNIFVPGDVILSAHSIDPKRLMDLRKSLRPDLDAHSFGELLLEGSPVPEECHRSLIYRLEVGYKLDKARGKKVHPEDPEDEVIGPAVKYGRYKVTEQTALVIHGALEVLAANLATDDDPIQIPSFRKFARINAQAGDRNGQSSRGLSTLLGNLVP